MAKRYIRKFHIEGKNVNTLEADIYYSLGGYNYFTYKAEPRGYWFSLQPFEDGNGVRCFTAFSGVKTCVLPCDRQSKKRYEQAKGMMDELLELHLADFMESNGFTMLDGGAYTESER